MNFPESYPDSYFKGLTAEQRITAYEKGRPYFKWVLRREDGKVIRRNEPLDLRVYSLALIHLLRPNWQGLAAQIVPPVAAPPAPQVARPRAAPSRPTGRAW